MYGGGLMFLLTVFCEQGEGCESEQYERGGFGDGDCGIGEEADDASDHVGGVCVVDVAGGVDGVGVAVVVGVLPDVVFDEQACLEAVGLEGVVVASAHRPGVNGRESVCVEGECGGEGVFEGLGGVVAVDSGLVGGGGVVCDHVH